MGKKSLIQIQDVWKKYDMGEAEPLVVLKEINLDIKQGEFVAITGPSGSGKSTMLHIVGALDRPSWGKVYLDGQDISLMSESNLAFLRGKTIGFIFQQFNLLNNLSALHNVTLPMEAIDNISDKEANERGTIILESLGMGDRLNHRPNQLSGGQQQRVAIARALANNPEVVLADEPTGNLDSKTGQFVLEFLRRLHREGKTIILITHDTSLVRYAERTIHLKDGQIEKEVLSSRKR